jgi:hypothetical protein
MIFKGEISQACGNINATNDPSAYGEVCSIVWWNSFNKEIILDYFVYYGR